MDAEPVMSSEFSPIKSRSRVLTRISEKNHTSTWPPLGCLSHRSETSRRPARHEASGHPTAIASPEPPLGSPSVSG